MTARTVEYTADGLAFRGELYAAPSESRPGVLLFPAGKGMDDQVCLRAASLAAQGFAVLAADYHGGGLPVATVEDAMAQAKALRGDPARMRARAAAALNTLSAQPEVDPTRLAAAGFCLGGSIALELARSGAGIAAAVIFHGELATLVPAEPGAVRARVLVHTGTLDPTVPPAQVQAFLAEMDAAGVDAEVRSYSGTRHAFTNPGAGGHPGVAHHPERDRRAWNSLVPFLNSAFGDDDGDPA